MSRRRTRVNAAAGAALVVLLATAGCGRDSTREGATAETNPTGTSRASTTTTSTTSESTTSVPGTPTGVSTNWDPRSLPSCAGFTNYTTPPRWLPTVLPDGLALQDASSDVATEVAPQDPPPSLRTEFTLAEVTAQGDLRSTFTLRRGGEQAARWMYDSQEGASISEVRGLPGTIAKWINRGDGDGRIDAEWSEAGLEWTASADNQQSVPDRPSWTVDDLAAALVPLELTADGVADPSHRFTVVGQQPIDPTLDHRRTSISLQPTGDVADAVEVWIEIVSRGDGASGLTGLVHLPTTPGSTLVEIDGRQVASSPRVATVALPDGSLATATANGGVGIVDGALQPTMAHPTQEELRELVLGLVAVEPSDPRLSEVRRPDPVGASPFCSDG